ncbi:hypothetical protein D018_1322A, partial [Vibrio parahaemolyticus VP2007-007]
MEASAAEGFAFNK